MDFGEPCVQTIHLLWTLTQFANNSDSQSMVTESDHIYSNTLHMLKHKSSLYTHLFVGATITSLTGRPLPIRIHDIACTGHEVKLIDCPHHKGGISCTGCNSTGVRCSYDTARKYCIS